MYTLKPHRDLFPVESRVFETGAGEVRARIYNDPDAPPSHGGFSDQAWYMLEFTDGRKFTIILSDAALHHDPDGKYKETAFQIIQHWLDDGGPDQMEFFG